VYLGCHKCLVTPCCLGDTIRSTYHQLKFLADGKICSFVIHKYTKFVVLGYINILNLYFCDTEC
jgi:hypothetical protein